MTYPEDNARKKAEEAEGTIRLMFARDIERESAKITEDLKVAAKWLSDSFQNETITDDDFYDGRRRLTRISLGHGDAGDKVWLEELVRQVKNDAFDYRSQARATEVLYGDMPPLHPRCRAMPDAIGWAPEPLGNIEIDRKRSLLWQLTREIPIYGGPIQLALAVSAAVVSLATAATAPWLALSCVVVMVLQIVASWLHMHDRTS